MGSSQWWQFPKLVLKFVFSRGLLVGIEIGFSMRLLVGNKNAAMFSFWSVVTMSFLLFQIAAVHWACLMSLYGNNSSVCGRREGALGMFLPMVCLRRRKQQATTIVAFILFLLVCPACAGDIVQRIETESFAFNF